MITRPILPIEDNPDDVALTLRALKKNNILNQVTVAADGGEALELLATERPVPGLILLDLKLPDFVEAISTLGVFRLLLNEAVPD